MTLNWAAFLDNHVLSKLFNQTSICISEDCMFVFLRWICLSFNVGVFVLPVHRPGAEPAVSDPPLLHGYPSLSLLASDQRHQSGRLHCSSPIHMNQALKHSLYANTRTYTQIAFRSTLQTAVKTFHVTHTQTHNMCQALAIYREKNEMPHFTQEQSPARGQWIKIVKRWNKKIQMLRFGHRKAAV